MRLRKPLGRYACISLAALCLGLGSAKAQRPAGSQWVLDDVTVVDTRSGRLSPNRAILIDGAKIAQIGQRGRKRWSRLRHVDGHGAFVVPGFNDMHSHQLNPGEPGGGLELMLANGITGFRQMSGSPEMLAARRSRTLLPSSAPTLLALPGKLLTPPFVAPTTEAAVAEIRQQKEEGADFIKIVELPPPAFFASLGEASRLGLPIFGHLPPAIDVRQASDQGMRAIEHLGPGIPLLLGCSTDEAAMRARMAAAGRPPSATLLPADPAKQGNMAAERTLTNPMAALDPSAFIGIGHVIDTFSAERCTDLARKFVANATWQEPTLIRLRTMELGDDPRYAQDPNLRYIPAARRQMWESVARDYAARLTPPQHETMRRLFALQLRVVKLFDDAGVPMLTGSDYGGGWIVSGFGLHQEFDLLAEAGLSPLRILQMTTLNPARFLHREDRMGTVEPGRDADIVLLKANPIASASNLHQIAAVIHNGHFYSAADLGRLREKAAQAAIASRDAGPPDEGEGIFALASSER